MKSEPVMADPMPSTPEHPGSVQRIVVVGGGAGATGVELAAELHNTTRALVSFWKVTLDTAARLITRRTEPHVKLH